MYKTLDEHVIYTRFLHDRRGEYMQIRFRAFTISWANENVNDDEINFSLLKISKCSTETRF